MINQSYVSVQAIHLVFRSWFVTFHRFEQLASLHRQLMFLEGETNERKFNCSFSSISASILLRSNVIRSSFRSS